ncbi:HSR1-like GTP-binding protein [Calderihabitans maritimus]|uniref:GTPase HflX n=1 Tax=Calderihabitans maritimus TaxID=1246530 RepID=A0A1Z5HY42_9FIRM|nr:HSR1-like GTP-binding protein [Calderihabitans maritimus]
MAVEESLQELAQLAETAGAKVVDKIIQRRRKIDSAYFIGEGLARDLAARREQLGANLIIFDEELSGTQTRNLEEVTGARVIDRTALILDVFAQRARTKEAQLQVELAQLKYRLPRLVGTGLSLSRLAGGIGTRGPGETKLETDRRHIRRRISAIEKQLEQVRRKRAVQRQGRKGALPTVAMVGYTNAGKSTLRYALLKVAAAKPVKWENEDAGTNKLFATLDPTLRGIILPHGQKVLVSDTVGFINKLPHQLVSAFKATLEEVVEADLLLHVVDASSSSYERQMNVVYRVLKDLGAADKPRITVYNKMDLVGDTLLVPPPDNSPYVRVSALRMSGIQDLLSEMEKMLREPLYRLELEIPYDQASVLSQIYEKGEDVSVSFEDNAIKVKAFVKEEFLQRLKTGWLKNKADFKIASPT